MKTIILTFAIVATIFGTTTFANAATNNNNTVQTTLSNIGNINKIEVRGNVEVYVSNGTKDEVTVNNNYYAESALVQDENGVLRISSYKAEKLVVYVTVTDLRSIAAYDNSSVKSDGRLSVISLDVNLYNNAYAGLNLDNYAADITVNDHAKADLSGSSVEYNLTYSNSSTVNHTELVAMNATETKIAPKPVIATKQQKQAEDDIAVL
jgi:hypothetical protein